MKFKIENMDREVEMPFKIKEQSWIARLAAFKLRKPCVAIVIGSTVYLYGVSKISFLKNKRWVRHEREHVRQFKKYGTIAFIYKYLVESIKNGYYNNRFEIEARAAEEPEMKNGFDVTSKPF